MTTGSCDSGPPADGHDTGRQWPHRAVLCEETVEALALEEGLIVVDATVGMGGHALAIAARLGSGGFLIGLDQDPSVLEPARQRLAGVAPRVELRQASYTSLASIIADLGLLAVDRVLMDLGVGSHQLDDPGRGLSFRNDGPLDMRFNPTTGATAYELLERASEQQLADWFHDLGEDRHARRIARALVRARDENRLPRTTRELADVVARAVPPAARFHRLHPATRVFQALRIAVNHELENLEAGLEQASAVLAPGGRLAVISFHSLEDRRVKHFQRARMQPIGKKPIRPGPDEVRANPRSRSAKLRVAVQATARSDPRASCQEVES